DTAQPDTTVPDATQPDTTVADTAQPDTTVPDATQPDTTVADAAQPDTASPDAGPCFNSALFFDGTDDYVHVPDDNDIDINGPITIEAWIRPTDVSGERAIVAHSNPNYPNGYQLLLSDGYLRFQIYNGSGVHQAPSVDGTGILLQAGRWYHVAGTYDSETLKVFVNGYLSASNDCGAQTISTTGQALRVGARTVSPYSYFAGTIDEVRISAVARYQANFVVPAAPFADDQDTRLLLHFDEGSGQSVDDASGNVSDGRLGSGSGSDSADPAWVQVPCIPDRDIALSCDELFSFAPGYELCAERSDECEFYLSSGKTMSCTTVCKQRGTDCNTAHGNTTHCDYSASAVDCDTLYDDIICVCAR
ncbi:MAG: LamG domain-containing protein, partial [Deltaproteobacteria bacterium]|nr:LamG domain-containing protein [Deltaproteobacteria bacterium]